MSFHRSSVLKIARNEYVFVHKYFAYIYLNPPPLTHTLLRKDRQNRHWLGAAIIPLSICNELSYRQNNCSSRFFLQNWCIVVGATIYELRFVIFTIDNVDLDILCGHVIWTFVITTTPIILCDDSELVGILVLWKCIPNCYLSWISVNLKFWAEIWKKNLHRIKVYYITRMNKTLF